MTAAPLRGAEATRRALVEAATHVFAQRGYEQGSVRLIAARAKANLAAVAYHFGSKDGLYREVLARARAAIEEGMDLGPEQVDALAPEEALRRYLATALSPLARRDRLGLYFRIFAAETGRPSPVFREVLAGEPPLNLVLAQRVVARFLPPDAGEEARGVAALWLLLTPIAFVRDAELLGQPPFGLVLDGPGVALLADTLHRLCLAGLSGATRA